MTHKATQIVSGRLVKPCLLLALSCFAGQVGCRGGSLALPQSLSGLGGASRVPPPPTGSFQVPGSYNSGAAGASSSSSSSGLGASTFSPPPSNPAVSGQRTSQITMPVTNFVNSISQAQNELLKQTNQAVEQVNRVSENVNSRVEQASARVDRLGEGVVQASNILSEAAYAPIEPLSSGRVSDQGTAWQSPQSPVVDGSAWRSPK